MENKIFRFQCEQTTALQDELIGALIGLARAALTASPDEQTDRLVMKGLLSCATDGTADEFIQKLLRRVREEKGRLAPDCAVCAFPCGRTKDYDMKGFRTAPGNIRSFKSLLFSNVCEIADYAYQACDLGFTDPEVNAFFYHALAVLGEDLPEDMQIQMLQSELLEAKKIRLRCMELFDCANKGC